MDEEIAAAASEVSFTPAVSQGIIEMSCVARKRVGKFWVARTLTVRRNYKVTDYLGSCAFASKPSMIHVSPIEIYHNATNNRISAEGRTK